MRKYFTIENLYRFLLFSFILSLCFFHGKVLATGQIRQVNSDFLTIQLYLADCLLILVALIFYIYKRVLTPRLLIALLIGLGLWFIIPRGVNYNYYPIIRLIEYLACFYIFYHVVKRNFLYQTISFLGLIESIIGITQFHLKHSIGLHWFGEPIFTTSTFGIAKIDLANGLKLVRAYGTFSHPNSLGAFLVIALAFTTYLIFTKKQPIYYLNLFIILLGIVVTFSRSAILAAIVFIIGTLTLLSVKKITEKRELSLFSLVIVAAIIVSFVSYGTYLHSRATIQDNATALRVQYDKDGIEIGKQHSLFGVGYGNVIYSINKIIPANQPAWMIQPPHNYLIIVSDETGLIGLGLFIALILYIFNSYRKNLSSFAKIGDPIEIVILFWLLIALLALMQFDHYFYDIPLMALMFWSVLGIISGAADRNLEHGPMVQW